jgi:predicted N-acetyltransferase YhbS
LAWANGESVGTVNLIENDDPQRQHLRPWLAALFVLPEHRQRGIGSALVRSLLARANRLSIPTVYLGTNNPHLYERFGAAVHDRVAESFVVMELATDPTSGTEK